MPYVDRGETRIWYTEQGTGFPMLTLAPGGMRSTVALQPNATRLHERELGRDEEGVRGEQQDDGGERG